MGAKQTSKDAVEQKTRLRSLTQATVAELFGVSPMWLRDNAHRVPRNDDSTYDAAAVARALRSDFAPATLPDASLERVLTVIDLIGVPDSLDSSMPGAIATLETIDRDHGPAGMAAVAYQLLDEFRTHERLFGCPSEPPPKPDEIRAEYTAKAEAEIADLSRWNAWRDLRVVSRCSECGKRRRGGKWVEGPTPADHEENSTVCEGCLTR